METFGPRIHPYQHSGVPRGLSFKLSRVCFSGISRYARASSRAVPTGFSLLPSFSQIYRQYGNSILDERYSDYKSSHSGSRLTLWTTYAAFPRPMQFRTSSRRRELNCGFLLPPRFTFPRTPFVSGVSKTFHLHIFQLSAELILDSSWRFLATRSRTHHNSQSRSTNSCPPAPLRWLSASSRMARRRLQIRKCEPQHSHDCNGCLCRQKENPSRATLSVAISGRLLALSPTTLIETPVSPTLLQRIGPFPSRPSWTNANAMRVRHNVRTPTLSRCMTI